MRIEDDPNHKLAMMIAKRGQKPSETKELDDKGAPKTAETKAKTGEKPEVKTSGSLTGLIAEALKFRVDKSKEEPKKKPEPEKPEQKAAEKNPEKPEKKPETPKTIVSKKKSEPAAPDPMRMAGEAAAAATKEAISAAFARSDATKSKTETPEDEMPEDFRHDYEVAKHLAALNPKYKDAAKLVLNEFTRTEEYARQWEAQNTGKTFDPNAEEHDEFYSSLSRPWAEHEFRQAEIEMAAEKLVQRKASESEAKLKELEAKNAKFELSGIAQQAINTSAVLLAKAVDEAAHDIIAKEGFNKLAEADPIIADELGRALDALQPMIRTAIEIDDPQQRIAFDPKKHPEHEQWLKFLFEKEEQYSGEKDEQGRLFASRNEYVKLGEAQRAKRWYLTVNHLISEMVADASAVAKEQIEKERERIKKTAERLGYVPKDAKNGQADTKTRKSETTKKEESGRSENLNDDGTKPLSPSTNSGVKIDNKSDPTKTRAGNLLDLTGNILFGR